jgi:hypothetical protein
MECRVVLLCLCLLFCEPAFCFDLDVKGKSAFQTLKTASVFALGGVGFAGTTSDTEKALRVLLAQRDAVPALEALLKEARLEGKLYALLGLKWKDERAFRKTASEYRSVAARATTMRGCIQAERPAAELVKEIEQGRYDGEKPGTAQNPSR